jgi:diguanylate cyclase
LDEPAERDLGVGPAEAPFAARARGLQAALAAGKSVDWPAEYALLLSRHRRLSARLDKVVAIADQYHAYNRELIEHLEQVTAQSRELCVMGPTHSRVDQDSPLCVGGTPRTHAAPASAREAQTSASGRGDAMLPIRSAARTLERVRSALGATSPDRGTLAALLGELAEHYERLLRNHEKLSGRMNKLALISDRFQEQLRDRNLRLQYLASTDALTGLASRQSMQGRLQSEVVQALRLQGPLTLIAIDIDRFKQVNDTYGHVAGDLVLTSVAAVMQGQLRRADLCGRWGGEEFLMLLANCPIEAALARAEQLRMRIAREQVVVDGHPISVTVSLGVVEFDPDETLDDLLRRADQALYAAKHTGRNCVMRG